MLTGARKNEVFAADRAEFNEKVAEWIIPAQRTKNGQAHIVPLSSAALAILHAVPVSEDGEKLFPARGAVGSSPGDFSK